MPTRHHPAKDTSPVANRRLKERLRAGLESWTESGRLAWILALLVVLWLAALVPGRASIGKVWGDEGTFLAMMQSLAEDGDLRFDERDAARATVAEEGRGHLILQRAGAAPGSAVDADPPEFAYSKPVIFPLLAAPFYAAAGELGPIALNLLALALALWLARAYLRSLAERDGDPPGYADLTLVSFAAAAVVLPYAFWRMSDSLQFSVALLGLVLVFGRRSSRGVRLRGWAGELLTWRGAPWLGTVLLALLVSMRVSNGLLALVPAGLAVADRKWRRAAAMLAVAAVSVLALQMLTSGLTGADNPYRAVRATFTPETGYPAGPHAEDVLSRFNEHRASHFTRIDRPVVSSQVLYASLYVWIGRHTGLFVYFPASILLLWLAVQRSDSAGKVALAAFLGTLVFYVGWKPGNYFGGETFLGNRYLLPAYPALLLALRRLPAAKSWFGLWLFTLVVLGSATDSTVRCAELGPLHDGGKGVDLCRGSQNHGYAGVFRFLPWETTSRSIEGVRDRYWAGELVRFVDPWAEVDHNSFELFAGRPPAEVSVAHWRHAKVQVLRVRTSAAQAKLVVEQPGNLQLFEIGRDVATTDSADAGWLRVDVTPKRIWRRHRLWFNDTPYWIGRYRLSVESPEPDATAEILFVGDPVAVSRAMSYELLGDNWPERPLRVKLRNSSPLPWERDDPVRVTLRWRLLHPAEGAHPRYRLAESLPIALPETVGAGEEVELEVPVDWPSEPGAYEIEVDLVLEQVAWFSESLGSPVLRRSFEVPRAPPASLPGSPSAD